MIRSMLYFVAAGATGVGGPAAAAILSRRGRQEAALYLQTKDAEAAARLLRATSALATTREQARAAGVDPDLIEQRYRGTRDDLV